MELFRFHLFVCTQQKPEGVPSCPASGSFAVLGALDREIQARGLDNDVQLTTCGCMGLCDEGPVMVVYPAGVWYRRVQVADVSEIVDTHLRDGKPVDRLVWNDAPAMKAMSVEHGEKFRAAMAARDKAGTLPDRLDQMIRGFMPSRCILTALELDIFTAVGDGANAEQIGTKIHANARAAGMLLNALVALGLLSKSGDEYKNTPESARFFVQGSKDNHRNGLLHTANIWHRWSTLTDAVRSGTRVPAIRNVRDDTPEWTRNFIAGMQRNAKDRAPLVVKALGTAGVRRILDLGGGSGAYSIAFAKACPDVQCEILDVPEVVPLTTEYVSTGRRLSASQPSRWRHAAGRLWLRLRHHHAERDLPHVFRGAEPGHLPPGAPGTRAERPPGGAGLHPQSRQNRAATRGIVLAEHARRYRRRRQLQRIRIHPLDESCRVHRGMPDQPARA